VGGKSDRGGRLEPEGQGEFDAATGLWEYYESPEPEAAQAPSAGVGRAVSWADLLRHWALIEADLADAYGIDLEAAPSVLTTRSWRWLRVRITGLLSSESSRVNAVLSAEHEAAKKGRSTYRTPAEAAAARPDRTPHITQ
jgi:hypothetical protein